MNEMSDEELRLNTLAMVAVDAITNHPEFGPDDRLVVIVRNEDAGGALVGGYDTTATADGEQLTHQATHQFIEDVLTGIQVIGASHDIGITLIQPGMN